MKHEESQIQEMVIKTLAMQYKTMLRTGGFAGEKLSIAQATRRKRMGYTPGSPDIMILEPMGQYHGLFVEMKSSIGKQSPAQKVFESMAVSRGYKYILCNSTIDAVTEIGKYMIGE